MWGGGGGGGEESRPLDKGGHGLPQNIFSALWASVWSKNKGGGAGPLGPLPLIGHWFLLLLRASEDGFVSRPVLSSFTFNKPMQHVQIPVESGEGDREPACTCAITIIFLFIIYLFVHFGIHLSIYRKSSIKPSGPICS